MKTSNKLLILFVAILAVVWSAEWWIGYRTVAPFRKIFNSEQMERVKVYKMPHNDYASFKSEEGYLKHKIFNADRAADPNVITIEGDTLIFDYELEAMPFVMVDTLILVLADTSFVYTGSKNKY